MTLVSGSVAKYCSNSSSVCLSPTKLRPNVIEDLYIRVLSRFPTDGEKRIADVYLKSPKRKPYDAFCDLVWALLNSKEFVLKH